MSNIQVGPGQFVKAASGSGSDASPFVVDVALASGGEIYLGQIGGQLTRVSVELTRPANTTAYIAGDVVADSTSAATLMAFTNLARVNAGSGYIVRAALMTNVKSLTPRFRVHLFNASNPTIANDNEQFKELYADGAKRLGYFDLPAMTTAVDTTNSDTSRSFDNALRIPVVCAAASRTIYALLEVLDGFTPTSGQKFTLALWMDNN